MKCFFQYRICDEHMTVGQVWPDHDMKALKAQTFPEAVTELKKLVGRLAARCNSADGYEPGDNIRYTLFDGNGVLVYSSTYELGGELEG